MDKDSFTIREAVEALGVDEDFIAVLVSCEIISFPPDEKGGERMLTARELETIRVARILVEEMDVNLPGVEVILRMRQNMMDMRRQFDDILEDIAREVKRMMAGRP
jgi:MerR family transcriptional regulator/heat shock protein HspR